MSEPRFFFTPAERELLKSCQTRNEREVCEALMQYLGPLTVGEEPWARAARLGQVNAPSSPHVSADDLSLWGEVA